MSGFGGGRNSGGRGRSRGRGRGRGRSQRGGRGGNYDNSNSNNNSNNNSRDNTSYPQPILKVCSHFTKNGQCNNSTHCKFAHVVRLHGSINASSTKQNNNNNNNNNRYNHQDTQQNFYSVSSVASWKTGDQVKIFTGSQDGFWRLWTLNNGNFVKEFEHNMGGSVECLEVASNFLFCGFESYSTALPEVAVGMIHAWDLNNPSSPPLEFHMQSLIPYAHPTAVTKLLVVDGTKIVSGSKDGSIKLWNFDPAAKGFVLVQSLMGHAREITGLAVADGTYLWSSSTDGAIRIWDLAKNGDCQYAITMNETAAAAAATSTNQQSQQQQQPPQTPQPYHTDAVTCLVSFTSPNGTFIISSSLDGDVKAWNGKTGQMVASEKHGEGVISMAMGEDASGKPFLLIGLTSGNIMARNLEPTPKIPNAFAPILVLSSKYSVGHYDAAVKTIACGIPGTGTFCTGGTDGKVLVFQITGDLGLS
jgi:WD40 repeat protein